MKTGSRNCFGGGVEVQQGGTVVNEGRNVRSKYITFLSVICTLYSYKSGIFQVCQVCWDPLPKHAEMHHHTPGNISTFLLQLFFWDLSVENYLIKCGSVDLVKTVGLTF